VATTQGAQRKAIKKSVLADGVAARKKDAPNISLMQLGNRLHWEVSSFALAETWGAARNNCDLGKLTTFTGPYP